MAQRGRAREVAIELSGLRNRPLDWVLLSGSRLWVAGGLLVVIGGLVFGAVWTGLAPLTERTPVLFLLFALLSGNVTLVAVVVSISQFVLSRHLESPGEIREQLREMAGYREEVGRTTGERVLPVTPGGFLTLLFMSIVSYADELRDHDWRDEDEALRDVVEPMLTDLEGHARYVIRLLSAGDTGVRYALLATLDTSYSRYFYEIYALRAEHGESLPSAVDERLVHLEHHVEQVDVARRYFKTVFIQAELASLSRVLLFIGLPVLVATVLLTMLYTVPADPPLPAPVLALVFPAVVTAGFAPLVLLAAYIVRLATVVRRTAAMYPFTTRYEH